MSSAANHASATLCSAKTRWRHAEVWTTPSQSSHPSYLRSAGKANSRKGDGALSRLRRSTLTSLAIIFVYDPEVPVLAPGGPAALSSQFDQATLELGNNLLVYTTEALAQTPVDFRHTAVSLYCSTSSDHTDFMAKLLRVRPDRCGGVHLHRDRALKLAFRRETATVQTPCIHWEFDLEPISCRFAAGERIRLEVASSAFPLYDRNPGTDVPSCRATSWDWRRSTQIVHHVPQPSFRPLPAREGDTGMTADFAVPQVEFAGVSKSYGRPRGA